MSYASEVLTDAPWGAWHMAETSGSTLADSSGNGRDLTITGTPTLAQTGPGPVGQTLKTVAWGLSDYAQTSGNLTTYTGGVTLEAWVYLTANPTTNIVLVGNGVGSNNGNSNREMSLFVATASGAPRATLYMYNGAFRTLNATSNLTLNAWHHIVGRMSTTTGMSLRIDGVAAGTLAQNLLASGTYTRPVHVHSALNTSREAATIGPVAAYPTVLSDARVDAHYTAATTLGNDVALLGNVQRPSAAINVTTTAEHPVYEVTSQRAIGTGTTAASADWPAKPTAKDLLVAYVAMTASDPTPYPPSGSGWLLLGYTQGVAIYGKEATASEPTTVTVTSGQTVTRIGLAEFSGASLVPDGTATGASSGATSVTSWAPGAITTTGPSSLVLAAWRLGNVVTSPSVDLGALSYTGDRAAGSSAVVTPGTYNPTLTWTTSRGAIATIVAVRARGVDQGYTLAGTAQRPAGSFAMDAVLSLALTGTAARPVGAFSLDLPTEARLDGTALRPVGEFTLTYGQALELVGVVRRPTLAASILSGAALDLAGTAQRPVLDALVVTIPQAVLAGTAQRPVGAIVITLTRDLVLDGTARRPESEFLIAPEAQAVLDGVAQRPTGALALAFPPQTDRSNRIGGRSRNGLGVAEWDPPVADPPPALDRGKAYVYAQAFDTPVIVGAMPRYGVTMNRTRRPDDRLVIGNVDVTYLRGVPTPFPGYSLVEPLMYGPTSILLPQVAAPFEQPGVGALAWLNVGKQVLIQRVDPDTRAVIAEDYVGVVVGFDHDGPALVVQVGGEAQGRAALVNRQVPIWASYQDIGRYAYSAFKEIGLRLTPYLGPTTGVRQKRFGGQGMLDYISEIVARSWNREGNRWTIMPDRNVATRGVYKMKRKDTTTIRATAYLDDARVRGSLHRDAAEEPNRIFGTGVTPSGMHVRNGVYPGLRQTAPAPYPFLDGRSFGVGTTNAATDTGDGITVMIQRLIITKYLDQDDTPGGYDNGVKRAIQRLQEDATDGGFGEVTGVMDQDTWRALYDLDATGYSLRWSHIEPMAQRSYVRKWRRSGSGAVMGRNPAYQPTALVVDRNIDFGSGYTSDAMGEWAAAELGEASSANYAGSITVTLGALVRGEHTPGDPVEAADVLNARDLRPGDNLWLPLFAGGIVVHIAAVNVGGDGNVALDVDTRARDAMEVWEVISRNRESRKSPARAWVKASEARSSTISKDSIGVWDEVGGLLYDNVPVPANQWVVFPVVAGQEGTVRSLRVRTTPAAEFVCAIFGDTVYAERLARLIGNPLTGQGTKRWADETIRGQLDRENLLLYVAGGKGPSADPLGYFPKTKFVEDDPDTPTEETGTNPLTGRWEDDASFSYHTGEHPVLWVAVYADRATVIPRGRVMWNQLEAGA